MILTSGTKLEDGSGFEEAADERELECPTAAAAVAVARTSMLRRFVGKSTLGLKQEV